MKRHHDLPTSMFAQPIHTGVVIACFDAFCQTVTKKTVVVVDNASIHRSEEFEDRIPYWKKHGLIIKDLSRMALPGSHAAVAKRARACCRGTRRRGYGFGRRLHARGSSRSGRVPTR